MKESNKEILKRYYRGETSLEEERKLKAVYREGKLPDEPALAFQSYSPELPAGLSEKIQISIHQQQKRRIKQWKIITGSIAAMLVLLISIRGLMLSSTPTNLPLSDNVKKERFEDALRVIGNVLEEKTPPVQKVLYEDNKLIIAIE